MHAHVRIVELRDRFEQTHEGRTVPRRRRQQTGVFTELREWSVIRGSMPYDSHSLCGTALAIDSSCHPDRRAETTLVPRAARREKFGEISFRRAGGGKAGNVAGPEKI